MQISGSNQSALQHIFAQYENKNSTITQLNLSVLGIGYAVVDLAISVDEQFLKTLSANKGQPQVVEWPLFSQLHDRAAKATSGGSAANTMKGLAQLGQKSAFLGKIGPDDKGRYFQDRLISLKVQPLLLKSQTPTTQVACLITPDKERTMLVFLGAGKELIGKDLTSVNVDRT
jgi:sugar/nucleoside kinase (ribokinase family)